MYLEGFKKSDPYYKTNYYPTRKLRFIGCRQFSVIAALDAMKGAEVFLIIRMDTGVGPNVDKYWVRPY